MRTHPPASKTDREEKTASEFSWRQKKKKDLLIYKKKIWRIKRLKKHWNSACFPASPFFCCHIRWGTQWLFPKAQTTTNPLFFSSSGTQLPGDGTHGQTSETYFYQSELRKQQFISTFIFSHSFYFPLVCILYTCLRLCLVKCDDYFLPFCITKSYLWYKQKFHMYEKFKTAVCLHFHTFGCIFL